MPVLTNTRHERFCQEILKGSSKGAAYIAAGYKAKSMVVATAAAVRLLANVSVSARIVELRNKAADKAVLDRSWVIDRLMRNAVVALGEETIKIKRAKKNDDGTIETVEADVTMREAAAANKALELLGKLPELAMFIDRTEIGRPGEFDRMSDDELERIARAGSAGTAAKANGAAKSSRLH